MTTFNKAPHNQESSALRGGEFNVGNTSVASYQKKNTLKKVVERGEKMSVREGPIKMLIIGCKCLHLLNHPLKIKRVCHNNILQ